MLILFLYALGAILMRYECMNEKDLQRLPRNLFPCIWPILAIMILCERIYQGEWPE